MTDPSKIRLSADELELMGNAEIILTKNRIMQKIRLMLEALGQLQEMQSRQDKSFPEELTRIPPKVSRGENYLGLPWLILDYPRAFSKENTCAVRTMFWWGKSFSITLQLSGRYKSVWESKLVEERSLFSGALLCINDDPWVHHFEKGNYESVNAMQPDEFRERILQKDFLKISFVTPIQEPEKAIEILFGYYRIFLELMTEGR
ncbi:MAG: hypothetical protein IPP93_00295 [Chitinophagaceae bacterium]|nr:hypothetical protein [Chitinophagaceae bacterium]